MILKDSKCYKMSTIVSSLCVSFSVILSTAILPGIDTSKCGEVKLRSEMVVNFGTVEIEYHPSSNEKRNSNFERTWRYITTQYSKTLKIAAGMYEQRRETNDVYVLKIYRFNISMNGRYVVYCGDSGTFTNTIELKVSEPPSVPVIIGLQNIEYCKGCIVGEDNEMFKLACEIHGGSRPLTVTMSIGNESYSPQEWNATTFMVLFKVKDHHHMKNVIFSVMNDALSSPLNVTAKMFVIISPDGRETGENMSTTAYPGGIEKGDNMSAAANPDGRETGDYMSTTGVGLGAVVGSVFAVLAVGILIGVISTLLILTRKGIIAGSKTQPTVSCDIELTGPTTALDTYEQLQNRTDTEIRGTYHSLEEIVSVNSRVQQNSQSQYESLNQETENYHTYTDLKQSR